MSTPPLNRTFAKWDQPHFVYIAYHGEEPLYIGCTCNPAQRIASHSRSEWIPLTDAIDVFGPFDKGEALDLERDAIWMLQPTFNKRGKGRSNPALEWADAIWDAMGDVEDSEAVA